MPKISLPPGATHHRRPGGSPKDEQDEAFHNRIQEHLAGAMFGRGVEITPTLNIEDEDEFWDVIIDSMAKLCGEIHKEGYKGGQDDCNEILAARIVDLEEGIRTARETLFNVQ